MVVVGFASLSSEAQSRTAIEQKNMAASAATGCMEIAMVRLGLNAGYAGNESLTIGTTTCLIRTILVSGNVWTIETWSQVGDSYARYRGVLTSRSPVIVDSWAELAGF